MKKVIYSVLALLLCHYAMSQGGLLVQGGTHFVVSGGTSVTVSGNVEINGAVNNGGSVYLTGDWIINGGAEPSMGSGTAIFNGTGGTQHISGGTNPTFGNVELDNPDGLETVFDVAIDGELAFTSGKIFTNNGSKISLGAYGSVTGADADKYVNGTLEKYIETSMNGVSFEIGDETNYTPIDIVFSSAPNTGRSLTAHTTPERHPDIDNSGLVVGADVVRYWTIENNGVDNFNYYDPTFTFVPSDISGGDYNNFIIRKYNGGSWETTEAGAAPTATTTSAANVTSFSDFAIGEISVLEVTDDPDDVSECAGEVAYFSVSTSSEPTPSIQWQRNEGIGGGWENIGPGTDGGIYGGWDGTTLSLNNVAGRNGYQYRAVLTNINGEVESGVATLTVSDLNTQTPSLTVTGITCNGDNDGQIEVDPALTGVGTVYYVLNGGGAQTSTLFENLGALSGATVYAYDDICSSQSSDPVDVIDPSIVSAPEVSKTDVSTCHGGNDGAIEITTEASGGTAPYEYSLSGGAYTSSTSFTGLTAGAYTINARDNHGCVSANTVYYDAFLNSNSENINVREPSTLSTPELSKTDVLCNGASNGTVSVSTPSTGGTGTIKYSLNGGTYTTSTSFTGLTAGTYNVRAQDANGCLSSYAVYYNPSLNSYSEGVTVGQPAVLSISASNTGPYAVSQTISLSTDVTGGTADFDYSWSGPASFSPGNVANPSRTNAQLTYGGNYNVTVTDDHGCSATATTNVIVSNSIVYVWDGSESNDWSNENNWTPVAPIGGPDGGCSIDVYINNNAGGPQLSSAKSVGNVFMDNNGHLTLNADLSVCRDWSGPSTASSVTGSGAVVLNGSVNQALSGKTQFERLRLNNGNGATMQASSSIDINTSLDLQHGTFSTGSGSLTFKSTAVDHCAIIDNFSDDYDGNLSGTIHAQRYYGSATAYVNQHFMGSPVNSPSVSQFGASGTQGWILPQDNCTERQVAPSSPYGTMYRYQTHRSNSISCIQVF